MGDLLPALKLDTLDSQRASILDWFGHPECRSWCVTCARRAGLPPDMADDVRSETWVRVSQALSRRLESFPNMPDPSSAHRYAARACERTAIDLARTTRRRGVQVSYDDQIDEPALLESINGFVSAVELDQWRRTVLAISRSGSTCSGCDEEVVVAAALRVLNSLGMGDRASMSELLYEALAEVDDRRSDDRSPAARQRKSRCGRCVVELLRATARQLGYSL